MSCCSAHAAEASPAPRAPPRRNRHRPSESLRRPSGRTSTPALQGNGPHLPRSGYSEKRPLTCPLRHGCWPSIVKFANLGSVGVLKPCCTTQDRPHSALGYRTDRPLARRTRRHELYQTVERLTHPRHHGARSRCNIYLCRLMFSMIFQIERAHYESRPLHFGISLSSRLVKNSNQATYSPPECFEPALALLNCGGKQR
jgi:hypothetical protein